MGPTVVPGRWTHDHDGDVVVFLIGMRVNRWRAVRHWWPAFAAMPRMLRELRADRSLGLLRIRTAVEGPRSLFVVQYWQDAASLLAYARSDEHAHRPAWAAFNRSVRHSHGAVGIWHETFLVPAGGHESLYGDMPRRGLGSAYPRVEATGTRQTARGRLGRDDAPPSQDASPVR